MSLVLKKKSVSKRSKLSWRKHVDIKDVDNFLEDQRHEERLGKQFSLRTDNELFQVDQKPKAIEITSKKSRRQALKNAPLKCFAMQQSHSKVPDPLVKRNPVRTRAERQKNLACYKKSDSKRRTMSKNPLRKGKENKNQEISKSNIWIESENTLREMPDWLNTDCVKHNLRNSGRSIKTVPKSITSKQTYIAAIEPPHPGTSYNPSKEDHYDLLKIIADKEKELIKEEEHLNRVTSKMFRKVPRNTKESDKLAEMSEGLPGVSINTENTDLSSDDDENVDMTSAVRNKKKDLKQRRKIREQRALQLLLKGTRQEKKKVADIYKLKKIAEQISKSEDKEKKVQKLRKIKKDEKMKGTKTLSKTKFVEAELDFNLKKDIAGNLRNVKKEGNLMSDRFKSLQKRNIIEPTISQGLRKRTKIKRFTKKSHQD
uniref:Ribosome biogenesis protein NOP53 n=1 Tax=Xenopsylla cheopis TaxID=163159 RepID=A0A6M2DSD8_XENCH